MTPSGWESGATGARVLIRREEVVAITRFDDIATF